MDGASIDVRSFADRGGSAAQLSETVSIILPGSFKVD